MGQSLSSIREFIGTDLGRCKAIGVDAYCRFLTTIFPHLTQQQVRHEVASVINMVGGGDDWSSVSELPPDEPYDDDDLGLSR